MGLIWCDADLHLNHPTTRRPLSGESAQHAPVCCLSCHAALTVLYCRATPNEASESNGAPTESGELPGSCESLRRDLASRKRSEHFAIKPKSACIQSPRYAKKEALKAAIEVPPQFLK